uniref:Uncharacterized protein n=1 Tax=Micrurus lemniscatus lemniscatus TaxID=129467 RepID=A0A2D4HPD7_MICLE
MVVPKVLFQKATGLSCFCLEDVFLLIQEASSVELNRNLRSFLDEKRNIFKEKTKALLLFGKEPLGQTIKCFSPLKITGLWVCAGTIYFMIPISDEKKATLKIKVPYIHSWKNVFALYNPFISIFWRAMNTLSPQQRQS